MLASKISDVWYTGIRYLASLGRKGAPEETKRRHSTGGSKSLKEKSGDAQGYTVAETRAPLRTDIHLELLPPYPVEGDADPQERPLTW